MDDKQVKIMLMFGSDASKAEAGLTKLMQRFKQLEQRAEEVRQTLKVFRSTQQDTSALEKELNDVEQEMRQISDAAREAQSEIKGITKGSQDIRDNLYNLRDIGEKISQAGQYLGGIGNAVLSPLMQASQLFLSTAAQSDPLVVRWKSEMEGIRDAWLRIGRVAVNELLPLLEKASNFMTKLADFVEANPEVVKIALGAGAGFKIAGEALQTAGALTILAGTLKQLGLTGLAGGLGKVGGGALLNPYVLTTAAVGTAATLGYGAIAHTEFGQRRNMQNAPGQLATIAAYYAGQYGLGGSEERARKWALAIGEATGAIEKNTAAAEKNAQAVEQSAEAKEKEAEAMQQRLDAFKEYETARDNRNAYERQAAEQRNQIVAQFTEQRMEMEREYEKNRAALITQYAEERLRLLTDFANSERRTEQDYYRSRLETAQRYQVDVQRAEEDHQRRMRAMQDEHEERMQSLIEDRDALGMIREKRSYERRRQEEEEANRIQAERRSEDFARQIQEMEAQFILQRQRRIEDFRIQLQEMAKQRQQQLAQLDAQHREELKRLEKQRKDRLSQFDKQTQAELQQLKMAEQNRLNILRALALNDQAALQKAGMELTARYKAWLTQQAQSFLIGRPQGRALGGAVNAWQAYVVGERGPELFVPGMSGAIVPNSLTRNILTSAASASSNRIIEMRVETSSLTLNQVLREVEQMLSRRDRSMMRAMGG
ncbi:MAG: hypothetical protein HPY59_18035 [Anaerolineae bacterium]|nr:hypothetical protein [Anaerolineae bacterium]